MQRHVVEAVETRPGPARGAGLLALALVLTGCASGTGQGGPSTSAGVPPTRSSATAGSPSPGTPAQSARSCPAVGTTRLPDGSWAGPLSVRVRATAPETGTRGKGSGELQVLVERGRVTGGTWALTWDSRGPSSAHESQATVRLHGQISGTVTGTAARPVLQGAWTIVGSAAVTSPVTATASVDESGRGRAALTVRTTACDSVTGTFAPSFTSTDGFAASSGTARWTARRTG